MRALLGALLPIAILCCWSFAAGQADVNFQSAGANGAAACQTPVSDFTALHDALTCGGDGCTDASCDAIILDSFNGFAYGPPDGVPALRVTRSVDMTSSDNVLWKMGDGGSESTVDVVQGATLSLRNMVVETDPKVSSEAFLVPADVSMAGAGSALVLRNVTILTSADAVHDVMDFARDNLPNRNYREAILHSGEEAVIIEEYSVEGLTVRDVTVCAWNLPQDIDTEDHRGQGISDPSRFVLALRNWDVVQSDHMDILTDLRIDDSLFVDEGGAVLPQIAVDRNVSVVGQKATHETFVKVPLLDLGLVRGGVKVGSGAIVKFENLELLNLALGPEDLHYGFLLWFLDFDRESNSTAVIIHDSTLVVSCREMEHLRYAIALLNDPLQTLLDQLPNLNALNSSDWNISLSDGVIIERGKAFGLEFQNVNLTCVPTHGTLLDVDFKLDSPLVAASQDPVPSPKPRVTETSGSSEDDTAGPTSRGPSSSSSLDPGSTLFKAGLGILASCIAVLAALLIWKCRSNMYAGHSTRNALKYEQEAQLKDYDVETADPQVKDKKAMKGGFSDSDKLDKLPAMSNDEMGHLGAGPLKFTSVALGGSHATEFIPDILKVSNDIDDKQLVIKELLGQGQNGSVHKGVWRELEVVVKTIVFRGEGNKDFHQQAIREVAITSGLVHPNVVCTYSYDIKRLQASSLEARMEGLRNKSGLDVLDSYVDWKLFIIQEFCEQGTLQAALKDRMFVRTQGPDLKSLLEIAMGIARGMHHIHSKNILHGNLKPSNVLLKTAPEAHTRMQAKIADFGLSLKMNSEQTHVSNAKQGEPFYMAREVMEDGCTSKAADVYAFGVVLWEMYMSQLSSSGEPTDDMYSLFPRLPWCCPAMYGVLATTCMHPMPAARPKFSDCLSFLQAFWHQQRLGAVMPGSAASTSDAADAQACAAMLEWGGSDNQQMGGGVGIAQYPESQQSQKKRRAYYQKCLAMMPSKFRGVEFESVYLSEGKPSRSAGGRADEGTGRLVDLN